MTAGKASTRELILDTAERLFAEQGIFARLMDRLRFIAPGDRFAPVVASPLRL